MEIPAHYRKLYTLFIRFAVVMMFIALLSGIAYQESAKKAPFSAVLPPGVHLESVFHLSLLHGHVFMMGVLVPLGVLLMMHLGLIMGCKPLSPKTTNLGTLLYLPASALAVGLMLYKGYHFLLAVRGEDFLQGKMTFEMIEASLFGGDHAIRAISYALVHTSLSVGLFIFGIGIWRSLGTKQAVALPEQETVTRL